MPENERPLRWDYTISFDLTPEKKDVKTIHVSGEPHEQEAINSAIETVLAAIERRKDPVMVERDPTIIREKTPAALTGTAPMLSAVIADFIAQYPESKKEMRKKHDVVLPIFLEVIGDKPVSEIKQIEIKGFFATVNALPPYATRQANTRGMSLRELAELEHPEVLSKSSFDDTYKACVRQFIKSCRDDLHDQGFPTNLHTNYSYEGKNGPRKTQRALTPDELKRLFEGPELKHFASSPDLTHQFWLPVLGLYTGARVNELCQLNPQTDLLTDPETGIRYILITDETDAAEGIAKTVKTDVSRKLPLHNDLIELGFPEYVATLKAAGATQLFPAWSPRGGRAAPNAIAWFSSFLKEIGLYGIENESGCVLLGMHAFRHTLLTYGRLQQLNLTSISGHAIREEGFSTVAEGYVDETLVFDLRAKKELLDKLKLDLRIPRPSTL